MYSFYCEDLQQDIDVTTNIPQPFWNSNNSINPLEKPVPVDLVGGHYNDLVAAHNNHINWETNAIKLGYINHNDFSCTLVAKAEYYYNTDRLTVHVGYVTGMPEVIPPNPSNWTQRSSSGEIGFTDYVNNRELAYIYFLMTKWRDLYDTPPAYDNTGNLHVITAKTYIYSGTQYPPTQSYPYGSWQYVYRRMGVISELPVCVPCQANGPTVVDCNVIVGLMYSDLSISMAGGEIFYVTDADGNYNPDPDEPVPEEPFDPSLPDPYVPEKDDTSDEIDIPPKPPIGVSNAGFINVYNPGMGALQGLGDILFPNVASATDVLDALLKICETLANQNLINYVIDCHVIPVKPTVGAAQAIKVGFNNTSIMVPVVTSDYIDVSCGELNIREYFGGFQDYTLTSSKIFLPFIGFVDTLPEYWVAGTIKVDYRFNVIDGSFMAFVRSTSSRSQLANTVIAQFAGNACMHFPITGVNYAQMASGLIGAATSIPSKNVKAADVLGSAYSAANTVAQWGEVQQSNGYNSTAALLGVRVPYLLIERPVPSYSQNYKHDKGYPTNIATTLSNVSGYTEIADIDLSGIPLTQGELEELRQLLADGVYF